jgi:hypothetical protein
MWTSDGMNKGDIKGMPALGSPRYDDDSSDDEDDDDVKENHDEIYDEEVYHPGSMMLSVRRVHGICPQRGRDYSHLRATIAHHAMTQYSLKKGLKKFQGRADDAVTKELMQLHTKDTFAPQNATELTEDQKRGHLNHSCS